MDNYNTTPDVFFCHQRKGAIIVMVAVMLVVLLGCAALAVDIGYLYVARAELQRTADAAAMAGAQALGRSSDSPIGDYYQCSGVVYSEAEKYASLNAAVGQGVVLNRNSDITIGYLADPHDRNAALQIVSLDQANAVQVIARRTSSHTGGEIPLFFAPLWGLNSSTVGASAIAVLDDRFYAYAPKPIGGIGALPLAVDEQVWNDQIVVGNGSDQYSFDSITGDVSTSLDGVPEVKLFPTKLGPSEQDDNEGAGNFGVLHIGPSSGTSTIVEQINNGISAEDFTDLTGEPMIKFYEQVSGEPVVYNAVSYDILGDPGMKVGMENAVQAKIGKKVGIFLYNDVSGTGANTVFSITGMRFVRVMSVDLHGGDKVIVIQPVPYYGPDILTSPYVPSTDGLTGTLELVR